MGSEIVYVHSVVCISTIFALFIQCVHGLLQCIVSRVYNVNSVWSWVILASPDVISQLHVDFHLVLVHIVFRCSFKSVVLKVLFPILC